MNKYSLGAVCLLFAPSVWAALPDDMFFLPSQPYVHYIVENAEVERDPGKEAPCNYKSNNAQVTCINEELRTINEFFKRVPAKLRAKDPSGRSAAKFKREQRAFEKRVHRACAKVIKQSYGALGVGATLNMQWCYYDYFHPRFVKTKRMLGEPHPVRRKSKPQ